MLIECLGCEAVSFRVEFHDYKSAQPTYDGQWDYEIRVDAFPKSIEGHVSLINEWLLPRPIREIYTETLTAIGNEVYILGGIGLRATVEAICLTEDISGSRLSDKINELATKGIISVRDSERLHAIRIMGNDAAHEIQIPRRDAILVVLSIVEHMLETLYLIDGKARQVLDFPIESYEDFKTIVKKKLTRFKSETRMTLRKLLDKDVRRITPAKLHDFRDSFKEAVDRGDWPNLTIDKVTKEEGIWFTLDHAKDG